MCLACVCVLAIYLDGLAPSQHAQANARPRMNFASKVLNTLKFADRKFTFSVVISLLRQFAHSDVWSLLVGHLLCFTFLFIFIFCFVFHFYFAGEIHLD